MSSSNAVFEEADVNRDGYLSEGEFRNFITRNSTVGNDFNNLGAGSGYGSSAFRSTVYDASTSGGGLGGNLAYSAAGLGGAGYGSTVYDASTSGGGLGGNLAYSAAGLGGAGYGSSAYESSSYRSSVGNIGGDLANLNVVGTAGISSTDATSASFVSSSEASSVQQYETDAQGNFKDSNPQVIRRPAQNGPLTYSQNIKVRFLQPPAVPPPGPLIIKEVRPPQPPPPQPVRVRQQAPPVPQPPPLILRERPPPKPQSVASQTVVRNLAAIAVPPRSVIIERIPADPPKPRDIVIERWIPYGAMAERKTIVQRAEAARAYAKPQNIIIQYEAPQVRVVRQFQRLGVTPEDPQAYIQRYGASLFDAQTLVQQARAAGVVEDISPPAASNLVASSASEFSSSSATGSLGFEGNNLGGIDVGAVGGGGRAARSSFYESSYSASGDASGLGGGLGAIRPSSYRSSIGGFGGGIDTAFAAADINNDGVLSAAEFQNAGF